MSLLSLFRSLLPARRRSSRVSWTGGETLDSRELLAAAVVPNRLPVVTAGQSFRVYESNDSGVLVGRVKATDADGNLIRNFSIENGIGQPFTIDSQGWIKTQWGINFEGINQYTISVNAFDGREWGVPVNVTIDVLNRNEATHTWNSGDGWIATSSTESLMAVPVSETAKAGDVLTRIQAYDEDGLAGAAWTIEGAPAGAFEMVAVPRNMGGGPAIDVPEATSLNYELRVKDPSKLRGAKSFDLKLTLKDRVGVTSTPQKLRAIIANHTQTITTNEEPKSGTILGSLPVALLGRNMQYTIKHSHSERWVAGSTAGSPATTAHSIKVNDRGRIIADQSNALNFEGYWGYYPFVDVAFDNTAMRAADSAFWPGGFPWNSAPVNGVREVDRVLVEAYDTVKKTTKTVLLNIKVRNVNEAPQSWDQTITVSKDGSGSWHRQAIGFTDPDDPPHWGPWFRTQGVSPNITTSNFDIGIPYRPIWWGEPPADPPNHQLAFISGNEEGIFKLEGRVIKVAKPELLKGRTSFEVTVLIKEKGALGLGTTAKVKINVVDTMIDIVYPMVAC